jgi:hypothetical protein
MVTKLENDIAAALKTSVASAMQGINAQLNDLFQANNKIVYRNMQSERETITDTMATELSTNSPPESPPPPQKPLPTRNPAN